MILKPLLTKYNTYTVNPLSWRAKVKMALLKSRDICWWSGMVPNTQPDHLLRKCEMGRASKGVRQWQCDFRVRIQKNSGDSPYAVGNYSSKALIMICDPNKYNGNVWEENICVIKKINTKLLWTSYNQVNVLKALCVLS